MLEILALIAAGTMGAIVLGTWGFVISYRDSPRICMAFLIIVVVSLVVFPISFIAFIILDNIDILKALI